MNVAKNNGMIGVRFCKGAWVATINQNGIRFNLGRYRNDREAAAAYNGAAIILKRGTNFLNKI